MNIYIVSLTGWETYVPVYFEADCSPEEFKQKVQSAINKVMPSVFETRSDWTIGGNDIYEPVLVELQKDKTIKKICSNGEFCIPEHAYDSRRTYCEKPDILSEPLWEKIIKHNKKCNAKRRREFLKEEKKKGFVWKDDTRYKINKLANGKTKLVLAKFC